MAKAKPKSEVKRTGVGDSAKQKAKSEPRSQINFDLRRIYSSELLDGGADVVSTQRLMGHSDPSTTAKYDRRPERAARQAAGLFHLPYIGRA